MTEELRENVKDLLKNNFNLLFWIYTYDRDAYDVIEKNVGFIAILLMMNKPVEAEKLYEQVRKTFSAAYSYYLILFQGQNNETN